MAAIILYPIPQAGLVISCAARRNILGMQTYQEADLIKEYLPENTLFIGFCSYVEIAPQLPRVKHLFTITAPWLFF
jgi:hypothetical protein